MSEERAVDLVQIVGTGTVLTLLAKAPNERHGLAEAAWAAVLAAITGETAPSWESGQAGAASALRASLDDVAGLTPGEKLLLEELLRRIAQPTVEG